MNKIDNDNLVNDIVSSIREHRKLETKELEYSEKKNLAIALSNVYYFNKQMKIWITTSQNVGGHKEIRDINGSSTGVRNGKGNTLTGNGQVVYRNSRVGELLIRNSKGVFSIPTPKGQKQIEIFNFSQFIPNPHNSEATDLSININEVKPRTYRSLINLLDKVNQKDLDLSNLVEKNIKLDKEKLELEELELLVKLEEKEKLNK